VETLGLHEEEKETLRQQLREAPGHVDPAARFLVGATNGMMYRHLIGHLASYPIPEIRLEAASNRTLLDIGCNWGRWCVAAARLGYRPIGIDPSLGAVLAARRVCLQFKISAEFVVGDARFLPFRENSLENVFSYSVLQHFPKNEATTAFAEARRVLRIGGVGMVQMANRAGLRCLYHQIRRGFREPRNFEVRYWGIEELRRMLVNIGADPSFSADCFFGIGLQASDIALMSARHAAVVRCSERLRSWSVRLPLLTQVADSIYVRFEKPRESPHRPT
jgi:SAM-dependent methyltransferase